MTRTSSLGWRVGQTLALVAVGAASHANAQDPRDTLIATAINEFQNIPRRIQLLVSALNPSGTRASSWPQGVQALAQTLVDEGRDSIATTWLRWAIRLSPELQIDTVSSTPQMLDLYRHARDFVRLSGTRGDSATIENWLWSALGATDSMGRLQVLPSALTAPLRVTVEGVGPIGPGESVRLGLGSYVIRANAIGYDSVRVTREVLPGVTTVLDFRLPSPLGQISGLPRSATPRSGAPPLVVGSKKKGFPWVLAVLGAGSAAAVVGVLAGHHGGTTPPSTGGIVVLFPNP